MNHQYRFIKARQTFGICSLYVFVYARGNEFRKMRYLWQFLSSFILNGNSLDVKSESGEISNIHFIALYFKLDTVNSSNNQSFEIIFFVGNFGKWFIRPRKYKRDLVIRLVEVNENMFIVLQYLINIRGSEYLHSFKFNWSWSYIVN